MRINHLEVENLRVFAQARFNLQKGMNLLVGENGAGKTVVLDALRVCLSRILPQITPSRSRPLPFVVEDIRAHADFLAIQCSFEFQGKEFSYSLRKNRMSSAAGDSDREYLQPPLPGA